MPKIHANIFVMRSMTDKIFITANLGITTPAAILAMALFSISLLDSTTSNQMLINLIAGLCFAFLVSLVLFPVFYFLLFYTLFKRFSEYRRDSGKIFINIFCIFLYTLFMALIVFLTRLIYGYASTALMYGL